MQTDHNLQSKTFTAVLKMAAPVFLLVGALHLVFGLRADALLGALIPESVLRDPALDSQNRFYGVAFSLYGTLLWLCATDLRRYATVLRCLLWTFFAAGVARLVSCYLYGAPPPLVAALLGIEIIAPALLLLWLKRITRLHSY